MQYRGADQGYEVLKRLAEVLDDKTLSVSKKKESFKELSRFASTTDP
jgi:hypothetical protein